MGSGFVSPSQSHKDDEERIGTEGTPQRPDSLTWYFNPVWSEINQGKREREGKTASRKILTSLCIQHIVSANLFVDVVSRRLDIDRFRRRIVRLFDLDDIVLVWQFWFLILTKAANLGRHGRGLRSALLQQSPADPARSVLTPRSRMPGRQRDNRGGHGKGAIKL